MLRLHDEIRNMREAEPLILDAAQAASKFVDLMRNSLPSMPNSIYSVMAFLALGLCVCMVLCLLPVLITCFINRMLDIQANIHEIKLRAMP